MSVEIQPAVRREMRPPAAVIVERAPERGEQTDPGAGNHWRYPRRALA